MADSFVRSYYDADEIIEPVVLYYSSMWLASGIIYTEGTDPQIQYWRRDPKHGVKARWSGNSFLESRIEFFDRGTVQSLSRVLAGDFVCNDSVPIVDLLRTLPDLDHVLAERGLDILPIEARVSDDHNRQSAGLKRLNFGPVADYADTIVVAPALTERGAIVQLFENGSVAFWNWRGDGLDDVNTLTMVCNSGRYLEARLPQGYYLPELVVHLVLLHALSDFARYRPEIWIPMSDDYDHDYVIIREYISIAERRLPNLALNELAQKTFLITQ